VLKPTALSSHRIHSLHHICRPQAVRHQAAAVIAALALSSPPLLAVLFGECLEGVETFCQQLMLLAAPYTKRGSPTTSGSISNSTGTGIVFGCLSKGLCHIHCTPQVLP
jgi:hypothetical protein